MQIRLVSDQFSFIGGDVRIVWRDTEDEWPPHLIGDAHVQSNIIEWPHVVSPGHLRLSIWNCRIESRASRLSRRIVAVTFAGSISPDNVKQNIAELPIECHAFVRIEVVGADGVPIQTKPHIGVAMTNVTMEGQLVDEQGHVDILAPVGHVTIYLLEQPSIQMSFEIPADKEDVGTVVFRTTK
jgi:hypothetical protein